MSSPNHDNNHLLLSRKIGDAVAAAATDGVVTSALRNDYLNRANKFIQQFFRDRPDVDTYLQGLVGTEPITFSSSGNSILTDPTDYSYFLTCTKDGSALTGDIVLKYFEPSRKTAFDSKINPNLRDGFTVIGNLLYAYENGNMLTSGTGKLKYIRTDYMASAGAAADIKIDAIWYDCLISLAAMYHELDKGQLDFATVQKQMSEMVLAVTK